jgi:hypothetical protein
VLRDVDVFSDTPERTEDELMLGYQMRIEKK